MKNKNIIQYLKMMKTIAPLLGILLISTQVKAQYFNQLTYTVCG